MFKPQKATGVEHNRCIKIWEPGCRTALHEKRAWSAELSFCTQSVLPSTYIFQLFRPWPKLVLCFLAAFTTTFLLFLHTGFLVRADVLPKTGLVGRVSF